MIQTSSPQAPTLPIKAPAWSQLKRVPHSAPLHPRVVAGPALCCVLLFAALAAMPLSSARAATVTWDASGTGGNSPTDGSGTWSTGSSNWASAGSDAVWTNSNDAVIGNGGTAGTITVSGGVTVDSITFNPVASGTYYTVAGGTITLTGSDLITTNAASATINSVLAGTTGLNISGTGTLTLGGGNTFSGGVTLTSGTISLGNAAALGSGTLTLNGGTITTAANYTITNAIFAAPGTTSILQTTGGASGQIYSGTVTGSGTITNGGGSGNQTFYTGNWSGFAGTLQDIAPGSGAWFDNGGSTSMALNISPTSSNAYVNFYDSANGLLNVNIGELSGNSGAQIQTQNNSVAGKVVTLTVGSLNLSSTFAGIIGDAWDGSHTNAKIALTETGTGTLTLTGANTYTGLTTINPGATLQVGNGGSTGSLASTGTIADNGNLVYNYNSSTNVTVPTGAQISGSGNLSATAGVVTLGGNITLSGNQSYTEAGSGALNHGIGVTGSNVILTGSSMSLTGDVGEPTSSGNLTTSLTLNTSATNGPINLNIDIGRSGIYDSLANFTANAGTGAINWTGANGANGSQGTSISLTGAINFSSNFACTSAETMTLNPTLSSTVSGVLSGPLSLVTNGPATLTLSGANSYSGGTTINGGTLLYDLSARSGSFSVGSIAVGTSGTLTLYNTATGLDNTLLTSTTLTGSGTITKTGGGYLDIQTGSSISGFTGTINVLAGTLGINNEAAGANAPQANVNIASGATLDDRYNSTLTINQLTGAGTLNHSYTDAVTVTVGSNNGSGTFSGIIESTGGSLGLTKNGTGTLTLSGTNTYNGATTLNAGSLNINNASAIGTGAFTIAGGTIDNTSGGAITLSTNNAQNWNSSFTFNGSNALNLGTGAVTLSGDNTVTVAGSTLTVGGAIGGAYSLTVSGTGTLALTGASTYSGGTIINPGGTLQIGNGGATGSLLSTGTIADNGNLVYNYNSSTAVTMPSGAQISGSGNLSATAGEILLNGTTSVGGSQSYTETGSASVNHGIGVAGANVLLTGSSISLTGDVGEPTSVGNGTTGLTLNTSATNGPINLNIALSRSGVYDLLTGFTANAGTGAINWTGANAANGNQGAPISLTGAINFSSNFLCTSAETMTLNAAAPSTVSGAFSGPLSLVAGGPGTLTITSSNTYTGSTTISGGTLQLGDGVSNNGYVAGNITDNATLAFDNPLAQTYGGVISGSGAVTVSAAGTETLTGANTYSGLTTINPGATLQIGSGGAAGSLLSTGTVADNGALVYNFNSTSYVNVPSGTAISGSGSISVTAGGGGTGSSYADINFVGNVAVGGSQTYTQVGSNSGANTYEGIQVYASSVTLTGSAMTMSGDVGHATANGGTLALNTSAANGPINLNISLGRADVWYNLTSFTANSGTGTISVVGTGPQSSGWAGTPVTLTGGAVNFTTAVNSSTAVTINPSLASTASGAFSGSMSLTMGGAGTLALTGSNTYTGATTVNAGTLQLGYGGTTGSINSTSSISGSAGATLAFDLSTSGTFNQSTSGALNVTQAGSGRLTLAGSALGYSGTTTVTNGTLIVAGNISGNAVVTGGTFGTTGGTSDTITAGKNLTVGNGLGAAASSVLDPSIGGGASTTILNVTGNVTLNSDAAYVFALNSGALGTSDAIAVSGTLTLTGALLEGLDIGNTALAPGADQIAIASYGTLNGTFAGLPEGGLINIGQNWFSIDYGNINADEITLTSAAIPEPGTWGTVLVGFAMLIGLQRRRTSRLK